MIQLAELAAAEQVPNSHRNGGTYLDDVPWRFVAHTVEGVPSSIAAFRKLAASHEYPPHLWYWPEKRVLLQTVRLDRSAFALKQPPALPERRRTNKARAIQVEIVGRAAETAGWPAEWWHRIGFDVLAPVIAAGYPINLDHLAPTTGSDGYGVAGKVRMKWDAWLDFDGLACHANVPGNEHWDIGAGRLDLIAKGAGAMPAPSPAPSKEAHKVLYIVHPPRSFDCFLTDFLSIRQLTEAEVKAHQVRAGYFPGRYHDGARPMEVSQAELDAMLAAG